MSNQNENIKHFTHGGQILLHNWRMFSQVFNKVVLFSLIGLVLINALLFFTAIKPYDRYVWQQNLWAELISIFDTDTTIQFIEPNGDKDQISVSSFTQSPAIQQIAHRVNQRIVKNSLYSLWGLFILIGITAYWLKRRGQKHTQDHLIKGDRLVPMAELKKQIIKAKQHSDLQLAGLPLIKDSECSHFFIHGTTGSGKSSYIKSLLDQIRERGDRAIIYDKSCDFVHYYYQDKDIILNPLDKRCPSWNIWAECRDSVDFDSMAAALMPMPLGTSDPFWVNAARTIFSAMANQMRNQQDKSMLTLLQSLLTTDLDDMQNLLKGTEAETLVSEKIEKTAVSIKSVLATYLKSLKHVKDEGDPFSIRQWCQDENAGNFLFVTSIGDKHETLKPLISLWLDIAVNTMLSLSVNPNRRIWVMLDELPSLHKLPYLPEAFSEARKFGGCLIAGMQSFAQLRKVYGTNCAEEISGLCNTRLLLRMAYPEMAKWSALNLGECEIEEVKEGVSYGANTMRDDVSISRHQQRKPVVSPSEIMQLDNLSSYIRLPGNYPITKLNLPYQERKPIAIPFMPRQLNEQALKVIDDLVGQYQRPHRLEAYKSFGTLAERDGIFEIDI